MNRIWLLVLLAVVIGAPRAAATALPAEIFFADSPVSDVKLAPSGRSVAMSVQGPSGR